MGLIDTSIAMFCEQTALTEVHIISDKHSKLSWVFLCFGLGGKFYHIKRIADETEGYVELSSGVRGAFL